MNNSMAVFLINDEVRCMRAVYEEKGKPELFKTFEPDIGIGDYVVVETTSRHNMTVVKIVEADVTPDFDTAEEVRWIICKIDRRRHLTTLERERQAIATIQQAEAKRKREEMRRTMMGAYADELKKLPLANQTADDTAAEQPPKPASTAFMG